SVKGIIVETPLDAVIPRSYSHFRAGGGRSVTILDGAALSRGRCGGGGGGATCRSGGPGTAGRREPRGGRRPPERGGPREGGTVRRALAEGSRPAPGRCRRARSRSRGSERARGPTRRFPGTPPRRGTVRG